jgi:hypothetical protein
VSRLSLPFPANQHSPYLQSFYERIKSRKGGVKGGIAVARKFLGIIYRTLKNDWELADFLNFVLVESYKRLSGGDNSS